MEKELKIRKGGKMVHLNDDAALALDELKVRINMDISDKALVSRLILYARDVELNLFFSEPKR